MIWIIPAPLCPEGWGQGSRRRQVLCPCPAGQALEGQQGVKIHPALGGRARAEMASKASGMT